ncbi:hypothetical protein LCGC14_2399570, partial [marine sediment metagenome]
AKFGAYYNNIFKLMHEAQASLEKYFGNEEDDE